MGLLAKLPKVENVVNGGTAIISCPVGLTYEKIHLIYTVATRAQLTNIKVKVDGQTIQTYADGDELDLINDFYSRPDVAGELTLYFDRPELNLLSEQEVTGLGTKNVKTLTIEVDIGAAATTLVAFAERRPGEDLGLFTRVKRFPQNPAAGENEIDRVPLGPRIIAAHFLKADVTNMEVEADYGSGPRILVNATKAMLEKQQKDAGRAPVTASATHVDFMPKNTIAGALVTASMGDFRFRATITVGAAFDLVVEYLDAWRPPALAEQ